jgi:hypothetical protein
MLTSGYKINIQMAGLEEWTAEEKKLPTAQTNQPKLSLPNINGTLG